MHDERPPEQPVAALTTARAPVSLVTRFDELDDDTALALRRALLRVETRWQRPLSWMLLGIPASCTGLVAADVQAAVGPLAVAFVTVYVAAGVVVPLTMGAVREEANQLGVSPRVLRQLRQLDTNTRARGMTDGAFLAELTEARARERAHHSHPTILSGLRRILTGP